MRQRMMIVGLLAFAAMPAFAADKAPLQTTPASAAAVTPAGGGKPVVVNGCGSCASSASAIHNRPFGGGTVNPAGCGCWASERTFLWGGCKQFFNPQFSCGDGKCSHFNLGNRERCPTISYGPGVGAPANNCAGTFSYLNR